MTIAISRGNGSFPDSTGTPKCC